MKVLVCIDDTDNLESLGTGELASMIAAKVEGEKWGKSSVVTRHQLLVHPDVPYTSHNSSMCFEADIEEAYLNELTDYACKFLEKESAEGSDPGLCIAVRDKIAEPQLLIDFGKKVKTEIVTKEEAYSLARQLGVHLSEHGGTGQGVIGALAGAGLRYGGNDGRVKGKLHIDVQFNTASAGYIRSKTGIERVAAIDGTELSDEEIVMVGEEIKTVFLEGKTTLLVCPDNNKTDKSKIWRCLTKQQLKKY